MGEPAQIQNVFGKPALIGSFINEDKQQQTQTNLQETRLTLNRKLAQRVPKQELVERGILPRKFFLFYFFVGVKLNF